MAGDLVSFTMEDAQLWDQLSVLQLRCPHSKVVHSRAAAHSCTGHTPHRTSLPGVTGLVVCVKAPPLPPEVVHAPPRRGSRDF